MNTFEAGVPLWEQKLLNKKQAAKVLGISIPTLDKLIKNGHIRTLQIASMQYVWKKELDRFCQDLTDRQVSVL